MTDVNTPMGKVKKEYLYVGAAGVVLVGIVFYKKKQSASQAAAISASGANTGIDPATGYAYGSAEDAAALSNQGAYINPAPYYSGSGGSNYVPTQQFTSNAQWAQAAEQYMQNNAGGDPATIGNALGKYITGQPLTTDQQTIVQQAIAFEDYPPVAGTNGYPPSMNTTGGGSSVPTPDGFSARPTGSTTADIWWHPVSGATTYTVQIMGPSSPGGSAFTGQWQTVSTTPQTSATASGLMPGTTYQVQVYATNSAGNSAPTAPWIFTTSK